MGDCFPPYRLPPFGGPREFDLLSELPPGPALVFRLVEVDSRSTRRIFLVIFFRLYSWTNTSTTSSLRSWVFPVSIVTDEGRFGSFILFGFIVVDEEISERRKVMN